MSDISLRQNVLDEIEFDPTIDAAHIGVASNHGAITLSGHVSSFAEKAAAIAATRRVKGVRAIADELDVRLASNQKTTDDEIAKRAADILDWDTAVPKNAIEIVVRDGWVTLSGKVQWHHQKKAAEDDIRKLSGITGITNEVLIQPAPTATDIKSKIENALKRRAAVEANAVHVTVKAPGTVILEGTVENWDERAAVENAAWSAAGVAKVDDQLAVAHSRIIEAARD